MGQQIINNGDQVGDPTAETTWQSFEKAKLNFAELYLQAFTQQGYFKQFLSLSNIPVEITGELERVAYAIRRGQNYDLNNENGTAFVAPSSQKFIFFTTTGDYNNPAISYKFYRIHRAGQSFGGDISGPATPNPITNADISPAGSWGIDQTSNTDLFIDLGDIGATNVEDAFNLGKPAPDSGDEWLVEGERIIIATSNGNPTTWRFVGNERLGITTGLWGGDDITNPNYLASIAADFDLLSNQPPATISDDEKILIGGNSFTYKKLPNSALGFTVGDIAVNGWISQTEFGLVLSLNNAASPELLASWDIINKI